MASKTFELEILTPDRKVFEGTISSLIVPAALGYLGVLANHAPMVSTLTAGKMIVRDAQGQPTTLHSTGQGLLEVRGNKATVLTEAIE